MSELSNVMATVWDWEATNPEWWAPPAPDCWYGDWEAQPTVWTPEGQLAFLRGWQEGRCAICSRSAPLVLDHDHSTSLVRGYLCLRCNVKEGMSVGPTDVYAMWRACPLTAMLGLRITYSSGGRGLPVVPLPSKVGGPLYLPDYAPDPQGWPRRTAVVATPRIEWEFRAAFRVLVSARMARVIEIENERRRLRHDEATRGGEEDERLDAEARELGATPRTFLPGELLVGPTETRPLGYYDLATTAPWAA